VVRDRTDHSPRQWGTARSALVTTTGGTVFVARRESMSSDPIQPISQAKLLVGSLNAAGAFGTPIMIPAAIAEVGDMAAVPRGDGFALVWVEDSKLRFAAFDAAGMITLAPRDVIGGVSASTTPRMASGPDGGFGVVYDVEGAGGRIHGAVLVLSADGAVRMPPATTGWAGRGNALRTSGTGDRRRARRVRDGLEQSRERSRRHRVCSR
jgi:hypothetical protein